MTIIPIKNGTTSITIECATLTQLIYDQDDNVWKCEYSDWSFGMFAMLSVIALLIPLLLIISCIIKYHHRHKKEEVLVPDYSRQTSYSSIYPAVDPGRDLHRFSNEEDDNFHDPVVRHHKPKHTNKGKLYFPYPAYGTFDESSLLESNNSLCADSIKGPNTQTQQASIPIQQSAERQPLLHISNSAPVVTTMLKDTRQRLFERTKQQPDYKPPYISAHSLDSASNKLENDLIDFQDHLRRDIQQSLTASTISTTTTSNEKQKDNEEQKNSKISLKEESLAESIGNDALVHVDVIDSGIVKAQSTSNLSARSRILSATPEKNLLTRQDFDDYLADCVLKLPEDQRNGTFLIRSSVTSPENKILTLYCKSPDNNATLYYFKIQCNEESQLFIENTSQFFYDVDKLIEYFKLNRSLLPCLLGDCLGKNF